MIISPHAFLELDLFYGVLGAILFRIRNEQTHYQNWISGFLIGLFLSEALFVYGIEIVSQIVWVISAIGLSVTYLLRFTRKVGRTTIDFLKLVCIGLLIIYPITFYTIVLMPSEYWGILRSLTLPFVAVIYIYDRWVLKKGSMKRKFVIILVAQTLLILLLFTFALFQRAEANKQRELAVEQKEHAVEQAKRAEEEKFKAEKIRLQLDSLMEGYGRP